MVPPSAMSPGSNVPQPAVATDASPNESGAASTAEDARLMIAWTSRSLVPATEEGGQDIHVDNGLLPVDDLAGLPLVGRRYRVMGLLGEGTFAQVLKCEDTFDATASEGQKRMVAVKVMNRRFGELGRREAACLKAVHATGEVSLNVEIVLAVFINFLESLSLETSSHTPFF